MDEQYSQQHPQQHSHGKKKNVTFYDIMPEVQLTYHDEIKTLKERKEKLWLHEEFIDEVSRSEIKETLREMRTINDEGEVEYAADDDEYSLRGLEEYYIVDGSPSATDIVENILECQENMKQQERNDDKSNNMVEKLREYYFNQSKDHRERAIQLAEQDAQDAKLIHDENKAATVAIIAETYKLNLAIVAQRIESKRRRNKELKTKIESQKLELYRKAEQCVKPLKESNENLKNKIELHNKKKKILKLKQQKNETLKAKIELRKKVIAKLKKSNRGQKSLPAQAA